MSKAVMISIKPKWCELIASGKKTVEVRKSRPKIKMPFKCYIYCTKAKNIEDLLWTEKESVGVINRRANGKVIGEFICDDIIPFHDTGEAIVAITDYDITACCLEYNELHAYANGKYLFGWHISDLVIYDKLRELNEFKKINRNCWYEDLGLAKIDCPDCQNQDCFIQRPPQSWCYVEEEAGQALKNKL